MPFEPVQENPVVTSWWTEGLVESAEFVSWRVSRAGPGEFNALEVQAVVPSDTLADEFKTWRLQVRLAGGDLTFSEDVDILVINLVECTRRGFFWTSRCNARAFSVAGKEQIFDRAWEAVKPVIKCP